MIKNIKRLWITSLSLILLPAYSIKHNEIETKEKAQQTLHARGGLPNFFNKLKNKDSVTIAYLGGSITEAWGYRLQTEELFKKQYPDSKIKAVNAGIGGTGSSLGVFRVQHDVLSHHPDLIFIEFAVNDMETDSLTVCNSIEGIVRQVIENDPHTDICFLYTINDAMMDSLQHQKLWRSMRYMERIADYYNLPSIYFGNDVLKLLAQDKLIFKSGKDTSAGGKIVFSSDGTHPATAGHKIYTATIEKSFNQMKSVAKSMVHKLPSPLYVDNYEKGKMLPPQSFQIFGNWKNIHSDTALQSFLKTFPEMLKMYPDMLLGFPDLIYSNNPTDSIVINFKGAMLGIGDIIGPSSIGFKMSVDGGKEEVIRRFDNYSSYFRRNYYLSEPMPDVNHRIVIKPDDSNTDKLKILTERKQEIGDSAKYNQNYLFVGNIMIIGEKL